MKKSILTVAMLIAAMGVKAQTTIDANGVEIFHVDSLFEDASNLLLTSKVVEVPDANQAEIKRRILNYAGIAFRDVSKVLVSESDDQLVFNYITEVKYSAGLMAGELPEYIRLVVQIKDGRFRVLAYDDGNGFIPGTYGKGYSSPSVAAHTTYFPSRFKNGIAKNKGMWKAQFQMIQGLDNNVNAMVNAFADAGSVATSNEDVAGVSDNW